jgi:hypothetical protein
LEKKEQVDNVEENEDGKEKEEDNEEFEEEEIDDEEIEEVKFFSLFQCTGPALRGMEFFISSTHEYSKREGARLLILQGSLLLDTTKVALANQSNPYIHIYRGSLIPSLTTLPTAMTPVYKLSASQGQCLCPKIEFTKVNFS